MIPSVAGLLVAGGLYLVDRLLRGHMMFALLASLAFGATAFATLTELGGASPLIYTLFIILLAISQALRRDIPRVLARTLSMDPVSWIIVLLTVYVLAGAYLLPRFFYSDMIVYVAARGGESESPSGVDAVWLAPSSSNITQAAYFALTMLVYFLAAALGTGREGLRRLTLGLFGWAVLVAATGYIDLLAKLSGMGDVLEPIRTANYGLMTGERHAIAGLPRINGAFAEASAFAAASVPACVFAFAYWRANPRTPVLLLGLALLVLVMLSTSTTAYVTIGLCGAWLGLSIIARLLTGRLQNVDLLLATTGLMAATATAGTYAFNPGVVASWTEMINMMLFQKAGSESVLYRALWNAQALQNFINSGGLGIGIGSTRTSSWIVAVVSHLGMIGALAMGALVFVVLRGLSGVNRRGLDRHVLALAEGSRAAAVATIIAASVTAPAPNPGVIFTFALATIVVIRHQAVLQEARVNLAPRSFRLA